MNGTGNINKTGNIEDIHDEKLIPNNTENLVIILKDYNDFRTELGNIKQCNNSLFREFIMGPNKTEGRPMETFKNSAFQRTLQNRLDALKGRLNSEHPKYTNVINCYCRLYQKLGENPCKINTDKDIHEIL